MRINDITYKRIALLIAICYVMNLLQYQISPLLHMISHATEIPVNIISHNDFQQNDYQNHEHNEHGQEDEHNHEIIKIIDSLIKSKNDKSTDESLLSELFIDKNLILQKIKNNKILVICYTNNFWSTFQKSKKGYPLKSKQPPRRNIESL